MNHEGRPFEFPDDDHDEDDDFDGEDDWPPPGFGEDD